jgi:putative DNA primase/helicase
MNHGNFRRQVILPFKATFDGAARIATLEDDLVAEGAGILNWMLEGLRKWQFSKLTVDLPKVLLDARQAYKDDMDLVGKWFAERVEVTDSKIMSRSMDLFADYKRYAESLNHRAKAHKTWSGEMKTKGYEAERKEVGMCYSGLALKPEFNGFFEYKWPIGSKIVDNGVKAQIIKEVQV